MLEHLKSLEARTLSYYTNKSGKTAQRAVISPVSDQCNVLRHTSTCLWCAYYSLKVQPGLDMSESKKTIQMIYTRFES